MKSNFDLVLDKTIEQLLAERGCILKLERELKRFSQLRDKRLHYYRKNRVDRVIDELAKAAGK